MKKLAFLWLSMVIAIALLGVLSSCKKDENDPNAALVGTWKYTAPKSSSSSVKTSTLVLKSDKTGTWETTYSSGSPDEKDISLWVASPEIITMQMDGNSYSYSYDYYISNGYLVIEGGGYGNYMYKKQ